MTEAAFTVHRRTVRSAHGLFHSVPVYHEHMFNVLEVVDCWYGVYLCLYLLADVRGLPLCLPSPQSRQARQ